MGYPRHLLNDDEDIVLDLRPHWVDLVGSAGWAALATLVAVFLLWIPPDNDTPKLIVIFVLWMIAVFSTFGVRFLKHSTTHFVLTSERLITRSGVFAKKAKDIPLDRINDITFSQTVWERLLGTGSLVVQSGSEDGDSHFSSVCRPEFVHNEVYRAIDARDERLSGVRRPAIIFPEKGEESDREDVHDSGESGLRSGLGARDLPAQLAELAALREKGHISDEEFARIKAELLNHLP